MAALLIKINGYTIFNDFDSWGWLPKKPYNLDLTKN